MASPLYSLYSVLRDHPLDPGADPDRANFELESLAGLKSAVETYVEVSFYCFFFSWYPR